MQHRPTRTFITALITIVILSGDAAPQSGRGRPRVPAREPAAPPPPPPRVPLSTSVIKQEQLRNTYRFQLRNGMTVIVNEQHASPIVAVVACFKVGEADAPESAGGAARLLQRLILRGMASRPGDRLAQDLRSAGAVLRGDTSHTTTSFSMLALPDRLNEALQIQADMIMDPALRPDDLAREAAIESSGGVADSTGRVPNDPSQASYSRGNDPAARSMMRLFDLASPRVKAAAAELRSLTRDQLLSLYRSYYRPDRFIISVVGDVSVFNALVLVQQLYGEFKAQPAPAVAPAQTPPAKTPQPAGASATQTREPAGPEPIRPQAEAAQVKLRYSSDRGDISQSLATIGFRVAGSSSPDWAAVEVLGAVIGKGRGSRLHRALIDEQAAATGLESVYRTDSGGGLLAVQLRLEPGLIDRAEAAFFKELDGLRRELLSGGELARAKAILEKRFVDQTGTYAGRAAALALTEAEDGGIGHVVDYRNQVRAVRPEDVQRVAAQYLTVANTSVHEYEPLSAPPRTFDAERFAATVVGWVPQFDQAVGARGVRAADATTAPPVVTQGSERAPDAQASMESIEPLPVKDFSTLNGPRAFVREDHSQPAVTVALLFQGGRDLEDDASAGLTELMLRSMLYGTPRRTPAQVASELEQLGAEVEIVVECDFFGLMVSVLSRNAERALRIVRELTEDPAFRDDDCDRARAWQLGLILENRDAIEPRSRELLFQTLFAGHPYSHPAHGRQDSIAKLKAEQIRSWYERAIKRQIPLAVVVGDTEGSALVAAQLAEGFKRREVDRSLPVKVPPPHQPTQKVDQRRLELSVLAIGGPGPKADSPDLPVLELIESAMNGPGGRLSSELVSKQSLVCDAWLSHESFFTAGAAYVTVIAPGGNEQRCQSAVAAELERLVKSGLTADEISAARAVAALLGTARLQSHRLRALAYTRRVVYRRDASEVDSLSELLAKITPDDTRRVASLYFKASSLSSGVVRAVSVPPAGPAKQN